MISPPSSSPSSPSPRKIKSSNQSSSALSTNDENDNENSDNEQNINESEEHQTLVKDDEHKTDSDNLSGIEFLSNASKNKGNEEKNEDINEKLSQNSSIRNSDENEENTQDMNENASHRSSSYNNGENEDKKTSNLDGKSQHSSIHNDNEDFNSESCSIHKVEPVEEDPNHPPMPVQLTAIIDNGTILANLQSSSQNQSESEKFVEEEEKDQPKEKSTNDVQYWVDEAMQLHSLEGCSPKIIDKVINGIYKERDNFIELGLYQDSVQANEALTIALEYKESISKKIVQKKKQDELQKRLDNAKEQLSNLQSIVTRIEPNMASSFEKEMNNLIKKQNHELNRLTVEWESPQKQRMYNRSSANLRNLRTQSILLFNSHRFDEMELASRTADAMEMDESIKNQRKLEIDFQDSLNKMLDRHQKEREQLTIAQKVQKEKYEAAKNHDMMIAQRRIDKLEREIEESKDPEKVWIHYSRAEAKGPPGPRPKAREGRKNCLQAINTKDFNTLNLPPLLDSPKWKYDSPRSARERQERAKEIAALSRTGGSAGLAAIACGRKHPGVRASYAGASHTAARRRKY